MPSSAVRVARQASRSAVVTRASWCSVQLRHAIRSSASSSPMPSRISRSMPSRATDLGRREVLRHRAVVVDLRDEAVERQRVARHAASTRGRSASVRWRPRRRRRPGTRAASRCARSRARSPRRRDDPGSSGWNTRSTRGCAGEERGDRARRSRSGAREALGDREVARRRGARDRRRGSRRASRCRSMIWFAELGVVGRDVAAERGVLAAERLRQAADHDVDALGEQRRAERPTASRSSSRSRGTRRRRAASATSAGTSCARISGLVNVSANTNRVAGRERRCDRRADRRRRRA